MSDEEEFDNEELDEEDDERADDDEYSQRWYEVANDLLSEDGEECPYQDLIERVMRALRKAYHIGIEEERQAWLSTNEKERNI